MNALDHKLRSVREALIARLRSLLDKSDNDILDWQFEIADRICDAERRYRRHGDSSYKTHIHLLRHIGDGLVWKLLDPHIIRQHVGFPARPPQVSDQAGFEFTKIAARHFVEQGCMPIISDITHALRCGDLVVRGHPSSPMHVECKHSIEAFEPGTRGCRQLDRLLRLRDYLRDDYVDFELNQRNRIAFKTAIPLDHVASHSWNAIEAVLHEAMSQPLSWRCLNDSDAIMAFRDPVDQRLMGFPFDVDVHQEVTLGYSVRPLNELNVYAPPPILWPMPPELGQALLEEDLYLGHVVSLAAFIDRIRDLGICDIVEPSSPGKPWLCYYRLDGCIGMLGWNLIDSIRYRHETVESVVQTAALMLVQPRSRRARTILDAVTRWAS